MLRERGRGSGIDFLTLIPLEVNQGARCEQTGEKTIMPDRIRDEGVLSVGHSTVPGWIVVCATCGMLNRSDGDDMAAADEQASPANPAPKQARSGSLPPVRKRPVSHIRRPAYLDTGSSSPSCLGPGPPLLRCYLHPRTHTRRCASLAALAPHVPSVHIIGGRSRRH